MSTELAFNVICAPTDKVERGSHKHLCDKCGCCWRHSSSDVQGKGKCIFDDAHSCPCCHKLQLLKYRTPEEEAALDAAWETDPIDALIEALLGE